MPTSKDYKKVAEKALETLEKIVKRHDKAAAEEEPGFTCGCRDCMEAGDALAYATEHGV